MAVDVALVSGVGVEVVIAEAMDLEPARGAGQLFHLLAGCEFAAFGPGLKAVAEYHVIPGKAVICVKAGRRDSYRILRHKRYPYTPSMFEMDHL